jgi:tetratricopeptide (TPR) repeat protein
MRRLALALALALSACTPSPESYVGASAEDSAAADRAIEAGDRAAAIERLRAIVEREVPSSLAEEDARVIRQDAYDRWARVALDAGELDEAEAAVGRGLALGERDDVFTANLLTTRGRIHEARERDREAARDYHRALVIQEALLEQALGGSDE